MVKIRISCTHCQLDCTLASLVLTGSKFVPEAPVILNVSICFLMLVHLKSDPSDYIVKVFVSKAIFGNCELFPKTASLDLSEL